MSEYRSSNSGTNTNQDCEKTLTQPKRFRLRAVWWESEGGGNDLGTVAAVTPLHRSLATVLYRVQTLSPGARHPWRRLKYFFF